MNKNTVSDNNTDLAKWLNSEEDWDDIDTGIKNTYKNNPTYENITKENNNNTTHHNQSINTSELMAPYKTSKQRNTSDAFFKQKPSGGYKFKDISTISNVKQREKVPDKNASVKVGQSVQVGQSVKAGHSIKHSEITKKEIIHEKNKQTDEPQEYEEQRKPEEPEEPEEPEQPEEPEESEEPEEPEEPGKPEEPEIPEKPEKPDEHEGYEVQEKQDKQEKQLGQLRQSGQLKQLEQLEIIEQSNSVQNNLPVFGLEMTDISNSNLTPSKNKHNKHRTDNHMNNHKKKKKKNNNLILNDTDPFKNNIPRSLMSKKAENKNIIGNVSGVFLPPTPIPKIPFHMNISKGNTTRFKNPNSIIQPFKSTTILPKTRSFPGKMIINQPQSPPLTPSQITPQISQITPSGPPVPPVPPVPSVPPVQSGPSGPSGPSLNIPSPIKSVETLSEPNSAQTLSYDMLKNDIHTTNTEETIGNNDSLEDSKITDTPTIIHGVQNIYFNQVVALRVPHLDNLLMELDILQKDDIIQYVPGNVQIIHSLNIISEYINNQHVIDTGMLLHYNNYLKFYVEYLKVFRANYRNLKDLTSVIMLNIPLTTNVQSTTPNNKKYKKTWTRNGTQIRKRWSTYFLQFLKLLISPFKRIIKHQYNINNTCYTICQHVGYTFQQILYIILQCLLFYYMFIIFDNPNVLDNIAKLTYSYV